MELLIAKNQRLNYKKLNLLCQLIRKFTPQNMATILAFNVYASLKIEGVLILIHEFNNNFIKSLYLKSFVKKVLLS